MLVVLLLDSFASPSNSTKNPLMPFSRLVALVHFVSFDIVVWSPSAPHIGMLYMFRICCCSFHWLCFIFPQSKWCVPWEIFVVWRWCVFSWFGHMKMSLWVLFVFDEILWRDCGRVWSFWMHPYANNVAWCRELRNFYARMRIPDCNHWSHYWVYCFSSSLCSWRTR